MTEKDEVIKCLDVTASLVLASIESGKFEAKDGCAVAEFFDKVYGEVCECMSLTAPDFIERYSKRKRN